MNALEITPDKQLIAAAGKNRIPAEGFFNIFPELMDFDVYIYGPEVNFHFQAYCFSFSKDLFCLAGFAQA